MAEEGHRRRWHPGSSAEELLADLQAARDEDLVDQIVGSAPWPTEEQWSKLRRIFNQPPEPPQPSLSVVYYAERNGLIKIGTSYQVLRRIKQLNATLLATEPGSFDVERQRHHQFAASQVRGEWFRPSIDLLEYIRRLQAPVPA